MEDRIENLRKQVIKVFSEDLCDESILNMDISKIKEIAGNISKSRKDLVTELETLAREKKISKEYNIKCHDSLRKFNKVYDNILRIQKNKYEDKIVLLSPECINNLSGLFSSYDINSEYCNYVILYLKEYLLYQVSTINLCVANYKTETRAEKLFNFLDNIRPDYTIFYNTSNRFKYFYVNCKIMDILATQPNTFYTNSLNYVSSDFIKNVYLWFRGNRYDRESYYSSNVKKYLNSSFNMLYENIIKDYFTSFKEILKKYGYKF